MTHSQREEANITLQQSVHLSSSNGDHECFEYFKDRDSYSIISTGHSEYVSENFHININSVR